jgi:glucosamine 6-phosphate synthetase-like amidotransferase/phosphosugar isomerase protein
LEDILNISEIKIKQIKSFLDMKTKIESDTDTEIIRHSVREMIDLGIQLEEAQADIKVRILLDPIDLIGA